MSAPALPIVLRWTPTQADVADLMAVHRERAGGVQRFLNYVLAVVLLALAALLLWVGLLLQALLFTLGAVVFALLGSWAQSRAAWRNPLLRQPAEAAVGPEALMLSSAGGAAAYSTTWQWSSFTELVETERSFVLVGSAGRRRALLVTYLPKRAAPDVDQLRGLLRWAVRPR